MGGARLAHAPSPLRPPWRVPAPPLVPRAAATAQRGYPGAAGERLGRFFLSVCLPAVGQPAVLCLAHLGWAVLGSHAPLCQTEPVGSGRCVRMPSIFAYQSSEVDWCESNFQHSELVAEFYNTVRSGWEGRGPGGDSRDRPGLRPGASASPLGNPAGGLIPLRLGTSARPGGLAFIHSSAFGIRLCERFRKGNRDQENSQSPPPPCPPPPPPEQRTQM